MKRKDILLFVLAAVLIAASFAAPPYIFRITAAKAAETPRFQDAADSILKVPDDLTEKIACFGSNGIATAEIDRPVDDEAVKKILIREMNELRGLGAVPKETADIFLSVAEEGRIYARSFIVIDTGTSAVFEAYEVHVWDWGVALIDASGGKILALQHTTIDYPFLRRMLSEPVIEETMKGWAEYYGLNRGKTEHTVYGPDEISSFEDPNAGQMDAVLFETILEDDSGKSVRFGLTYRFMGEGESYTWGAVTPSGTGNEDGLNVYGRT